MRTKSLYWTNNSIHKLPGILSFFYLQQRVCDILGYIYVIHICIYIYIFIYIYLDTV